MVSVNAGDAKVGNSVKVQATATDDVGVSTIEFYGDGVLFGTSACSGPTCTASQTWPTRSLSRGTHTLTVVATDGAGNTKTSSPVSITR